MTSTASLPASFRSVIDRLSTSPEHASLMIDAYRFGNELDASFDGALGRPHWEINRDYEKARRALIAYEAR